MMAKAPMMSSNPIARLRSDACRISRSDSRIGRARPNTMPDGSRLVTTIQSPASRVDDDASAARAVAPRSISLAVRAASGSTVCRSPPASRTNGISPRSRRPSDSTVSIMRSRSTVALMAPTIWPLRFTWNCSASPRASASMRSARSAAPFAAPRGRLARADRPAAMRRLRRRQGAVAAAPEDAIVARAQVRLAFGLPLDRAPPGVDGFRRQALERALGLARRRRSPAAPASR